MKEKIYQLWNAIYPGRGNDLLDAFFHEIEILRREPKGNNDDWYKDAVIYALYVDLFNKDFAGLEAKLDYLAGLGVNTLWLLPILDSPMRDAGFDIRDYRNIRAELLGEEGLDAFLSFVKSAHRRGIRVIFDMAINHTSEEHPWFVEARKSPANKYRDYYIWSKDTSLYREARVIFKGIEESNWQQEDDEWYYFHRFFYFQPDLNYRNPVVLLEMTRNMLFWQRKGVDGFRADAIPYLWKEAGTDCENLGNTHRIVKFFRAVLDYVQPGTLLLAEACQKPKEVVAYFGEGDECHAAYHFPLMPMIFKALAAADATPIRHILSEKNTPAIPAKAQWLTFLRVHDELSLERVYVSEEDRKYIHEHYCRKPEWDFRLGEGISARLSELLERDERKIALAYSIMLSLTGSPVVYYGDEFGKLNDEQYYRETIQFTGKDDTRFLVRGRIDWAQLEGDLKDENSFHKKVFDRISAMLNLRKKIKAFGRGDLQFVDFQNDKVLAYVRKYQKESYLVIHNLSASDIEISHPLLLSLASQKDLLGQPLDIMPGSLRLIAFRYLWCKVE